MHCSPWCVSRGPWSATGSHSSHGPDCGIFSGPQLLSPVSPLVVCTSHKSVGETIIYSHTHTQQIFSSRRLLCLHCSMTKKIHCVFRKQRRPAQAAQASSHRKHEHTRGLWTSSRTPTNISMSFHSRPPKFTWFANINYVHVHTVYTRLFFPPPPKSLGTRLYISLACCSLHVSLPQ